MRVQPHRQLLENMTRSNFCLMLPGNSQSSQRLTEAFLTGCIPVFVGPPWHSLPLTQLVRLLQEHCCPGMTALKPSKAPRSCACLCPQVDYSAVGVFLNITFTGAAGGVPWWWTHPEVKAQEGLDPRAQARLSHDTRHT